MALILNIDTALETASFNIAKDGIPLIFKENTERNEQASWLHEAIRKSFLELALPLKNIDAVAVSNGPGSYTGLRIGLAAAKGLCYALQKPLICLNTLEVMAHTIIEKTTETFDLICPMIDARRMEVFTALYDNNLKIVLKPTSMVLTDESFSTFLNHHKIVFTGNGATKFQHLTKWQNARFLQQNFNANNMLHISEKQYINNNFSELAYSEPFYLKPVYIAGTN